mgnify:FL=1
MSNRSLSQRGFTLFEIIAVLTIMGVLAAISVPTYKRYVIKANEAVLKEDLYQMRKAIDDFFADKRSYPSSLEDLVEQRYLRRIPKDPITRSSDTWETVAPEPPEEGEPAEGEVFDVFSGSEKTSLDGSPYNQW